MNENIKWVYDELKKIDKDYDLGDYEEFDSIMNADGESRKWVYEQLQNNGYDIGDTYEEFESYIVPKSLSSLWEGDAPGAINNNVANISPKALQQATQSVPQPQVVEQAKATNQEQASGKVTAAPTAPSAPKAEETTPTATTSATPMVEAATGVAEQPKSVATETSTQETEQSTTPLSVQRDMAEQKGEEVVTGVQEKTELPADEYWATHAKELGRLVPQAPQGYVVDNMPQFVTVGMLSNFYSNQYDAKVSGVIYNAIKRNMTKNGVEPTEEDIKAKIATMSEDAIANALNNEDKNAIYALKEEFKRADSNKSNASAMISKVIDATPEEDRKQEGEFLEIPDNMLDVALPNVVNGTDKDLEEYIASEDYNKVYRKAIADWANVKELFGEEAYNNTINGTELDQYVRLGSVWRKMFGFSNGTNYPKQYENLVTSKMRDVYNAEDKRGALNNLYNAIGTIDSYIDVKNKLSQEELDAVLAQVNATIPWGSKLASWDDAFFYNHSKDAGVPYAMTAQARALMALNDYTDNVTMARANDGAIKTLEEQIQKRAEENRAKVQEQVNANPLKYSNEILLTPNSFASNFGMDTEYDYLNSALEIRKEAKEYKDNASVDEGFVANLWRGLTDKALDLGTWDFGLGEFKEAGMLMAITNKSDKGEALTAGEEAFLDAIATRLATFATTKATKGYSTGASTAESLAFMLEFAITPIKGGSALANKFARMMIAKYGKAMARKQAIKYFICVGGDLMKAGGMAATTGAPSVVADAMMRNIGDVSYRQMNDGSIVALRNNDGSIKTTTTKKIDGVETTTEGGESWGTAIKNAFLSRTATNMSEAIGAYLPGKAFAKTVGNKLGLAKLVKAYDKMSATDWAKAADRFFKKTQWNGFGQEYIEELVDGTLQALITQDTSVGDVFETENLIDTALAVGVMSVLMSGAKTMGYRTASYQLKQDINNTTITGQDLFGKSEWAQIQSAIDGSTADNMSANVQSLINNNELSAPQKKTILRYAMQVAERDALLTNEDKQALAYEGETNIDNTARLQASAYQGYHTTDTQEQFITNQQYIEKGKSVATMLGGEDADNALQQRYKTNGSYELADKVSHDTSLDVKQKQTILDYLGAKEKVASMGVRAQNDINNATINVGREVERKSNIQTGDILTVTHKYDGKQYYVIDGNVVTNQDGSINLDETTDDIIVEDAETGQRMMMSPKMFAEAQLKPSGIKDAMREELNRRAEAYNNTIKYGHTLAVGSNITLRNAEGVDENKTIASVDNNAGVVTFADGTTTTLDAIAEDARLRYSNQYPPSAVKPVVATKEEAQAENVGEPVVAEVTTTESVEEEPTAELEEVATPSPTQTPTEYNQEEQVVFIDDNGTRIEGEIVSEVDAEGKVLIEDADGGVHQVATTQIVERIGATPVAEAQGDNNVEPTTDATSEGSSQEILDNSNEVGTTTPTAETPTQSTPLTEIPTDEKGKKQYEQASVEDTINDIYNDPELDEEDADAYVQARIDGASKRIAQLEKKKPKMGEDIPGFKAERAKWREQLEAEQASLAYWQGVQEAVPEVRRRERARQQMEADLAEQERARQARAEQALRAEERGRNRGDYRKAMAQWNDTPGSFYEYVVQELLAGDYKMRWDDNGSTRGLGSHTTGRRNRNRKGEVKTSRGAEYNALRWLIDNNGISPEALADRLWNDYSDSYGEDMSGANPLDVLLDVITSMPTPQMMWDYVKGEHDARMEAEQGIEEQFTEAEIEAMERDAMYRDKYGVSEEEYWSQEAQWDEFIESRDMSAEELGNYDNFVAEQRIKEEYERRNQENAEDEQRSNNSESERGTDVLSGTQSDNTRGNGDVAGESEGIDGSSVEQDDVAQEEARLSEEDRQAIENMPIPMLKQQIKETTTTLINISQLSSEWQEKNRDNIERAKLILAYAKEELARKEGLKKSNKWGIKIGNSATPFSVVRKMFGEFNSNEDIAQLFDKVAKVFESLPIKIVFSDTIGSKGTQGWFSPTTATLKLPGHFVYGGRSLEQSKAETILHEMIHAVTTYALYINEKPHLQTDLGFRLSDDMHAAIRQLKRIYASIASDKDFKGEYGATSVHEMVAELSNVQFRDKLKKKNLWETIVDAIKQLFGIKPSNALEGAEAALEYMLNNFDRRQWDKMANMRGKRNKQLMIENTTGLVDTPASRSLEVEERTMLNRLAKALGVEIEVVPTMAEANAKIVGNKITLALDAEQGAKKALGHELLHRIKALSPEAYEEFAQVIEAINPRAFEQAMIDVRLMYSRAGRTKSREALREEVVADMAGELMYNADLMERFVDALETKSFKEQILNAIKSVFDAIKDIFKGADARAIAKAERVLYNAMKRANMVVNQGNTTEADSANEKLSIIGAKGASALDKAEGTTRRMDDLEWAKKATRHSPQRDIHSTVNWERGADGIWRFEIGDIELKQTPEQGAEYRLEDLVEQKELFTAYPSLKDFKVQIRPLQKGIFGSAYHKVAKSEDGKDTKIPTRIVLDYSQINDLQEFRKILAHEIQHVIQNTEGFARGANTSEKGYQRYAGEVEARNVMTRIDMTPRERRDKSLYETEDVWRTNQIVTGFEGEALFSLRSNSPFYSNAEYAVENIKQGKATPEQWLAMIQKNGGLKAGEDKWLGLSDWLKASDAKTLTKEEVLEFIKANQIVVEEVRYDKQRDFTLDAQAKKNLAEKWGQEFAYRFARAFNVEYDEYDERAIATLVNAKEALALYNEAHGEDWELYEDGTIPDEVIDDVEDWVLTIAEGAMGDMRVINRTRLNYTTEGLDNKREIALVVPSVDPYNQNDEVHFGDAGGGRAVAWVRFGETTDENGNRVLVIDEIQSKRHQDGREKGYRDAEMDKRAEEARKAYIEADKAFNQFREQLMEKYNYSSLVQGTAEERREGRKIWRSKFTPEEMTKYDQLHNKVIDTLAAHDNLPRQINRVPDAPFDKNWQELAMKRMLRYAAENGYDKVAWTTGAQQAERYNLGNSISKISVSKSYDGANKVISFDYRNPEGYPDFYQSVVDANGKIIKGDFVGNMLSDVVGKELATKLMETEEGSISGDNLRLGGEGMKGFYDKMLPSFMNKYGKKWGVKVGEVTMSELQEGYQTMHSIDVTDAMKESVMEGQPLFSLRRNADKRKRDEQNYTIDQAMSIVTGKSVKETRAMRKQNEKKRKELAQEIYDSVLKGEFNDVTLQKINDYINDATPKNPYGRRVSQRLPQAVERSLYEGARTNAIDALFSRISESAVSANGRFSEGGRRSIEERKKEALKGWAIATGNWHTDISDFVADETPIGEGTDSKVYLSKDGKHVIKFSKGKPYGKRFRSDIDNIPLFNLIFPNSAYTILGYGEIDGNFVRILQQPVVDFTSSTPLTKEERVEYMTSLGFYPLNDGATAFSNDEIVVADLQKSNIVKDADGNISVIDADMKLHTIDIGGKYYYPPVEEDLPVSANDAIDKMQTTEGEDVKYSLRSKGVLHPDKSDADGTRAKYNERVGSSGFKWREGYQDSMLSLKVLQEIIAEKHGLKEIPSWQNAYVEENEMSSRNKAMSDMYQRDFFKPLMAEVKRLIDKEGLKYEDIVTYLMAKHGLERNAVKAIEVAEQLADESMPKSADGKIDRDSNEWKKAFNEAYRETSKRDFSGLRGLFKTADVTIATGNAQMVVERMEQAVDTNALWNVIRSATNETLDIQRKGGLISKATYETLRDKYQFYIPLRGFNEKTAKDEYEYLTSSTPLLPPTMKRAKGRASMADDPLAHIGMLADSAIIQANRNKMKQAFYHFVVNNPSSVASVSEQWYVRNETTGRWESRNPIIPNGASADEMAEILSQFEAEMKELASSKKARRKRGDIKTDFITLPYQASEHEVRVKINGRDYTIYINGNPRAAQALNGLTNPEQFNDIITKGGRVINNFMAQMFTSKNPAFIVTNMARDLQWATNAVMVKEGFAYQKEYFKSLAEATKVLTMIAKHNKGILDMDDKTQRYFEEFLRYGGETGYTAINQIEEYKKNVERLVKDAKGMTTLPAKSWHALVDGIEYLNRSAEDFTRFAVYMASREMGRTPERSAHDAKEITVNFNKKGSGVMGARYFSAAIIFFNASLQSLNNMARMFKHHPIKMSGAMSLPALVGFALPAILKAWMGDDDDEMYNNLPDWVRRNNIVFPFFGNTFLTIPLPHEMRPFYTMGTVAYDVIFNGYDAIEGLRDVALGFADMLPIDFAGNGGNIFVNMTPTFFQPVAQIMANVDYFGKPIYKKSEFYENDPEHSIAFKGTSPILIEASRLINAIGGGNDYRLGAVEKGLGSMKMLNNPDVWEHLIDSYFGGVGKTAMRTIKTAQIIYGEALELFGKENKFAELNEVRNYPVLSSFIAGGEERTGAQYKITEQYYELLDKAKDYKEDLGDYKRAAIHDMKYAEELVEFMNTPESKEARVVLGYDTYRNILKKHLDLVDERRLDEINRAMADAMQEMLEAVKNAQSMTNEEILKKNSELVGKAKDLIYQEGDSVLDKNKGRLALLDAAVKYNNVDILEELLNNEQ